MPVFGRGANPRRFHLGEDIGIDPLPGGTHIEIPDIHAIELIVARLIIGPVGDDPVSFLGVHDQPGSLLDNVEKGEPAAGELLQEFLAEGGRQARFGHIDEGRRSHDGHRFLDGGDF